MHEWKDVSVAGDIDIYSVTHTHPGNALPVNTNGLLRQYFPKGTTSPSQRLDLDWVATELNDRPENA